MELMHHYTTSTAHTLALRADMQDVWRTVVPQMGYEHPFVLHGILAVSAIHKAHLLPSQREKYLDIAAYHQTRGLEGFRTALFYIRDTNWKPSFCFSSTIVLYVCALAAHGSREPAAGTLSEILKLFVLTDLPEGSRRDYEFAVSELRKATILLAKAGSQSEVGMLFFFPYTVPSSIIADIQVGNPYVMVLLSYFALLLRVIQPSFWFLQGWSEQLFEDIEWRLKDNPRLWNVAQWPKQKAAELYK
ncbi:sterol regulatory element-binding protein ECM22 [Colletotrichum liriopes]|uniref:Sterol regulatory element-binding protein ECM22 n=1 Tax=Colletotrichum liriopes TaxID=708192 RepID=A0AA37LXG2_9PEZI|nr:sterol regulatory element-binding protein ECM22 [Colletotrichum liriopes]